MHTSNERMPAKSFKQWEAIEIQDWRGTTETTDTQVDQSDADERYAHLKDERIRLYRPRARW